MDRPSFHVELVDPDVGRHCIAAGHSLSGYSHHLLLEDGKVSAYTCLAHLVYSILHWKQVLKLSESVYTKKKVDDGNE